MALFSTRQLITYVGPQKVQLSDLHDQAKLHEIQPPTCLYACESLSSGEVPFLDGDGTAGMNLNMQGMFMLCQSARKCSSAVKDGD